MVARAAVRNGLPVLEVRSRVECKTFFLIIICFSSFFFLFPFAFSNFLLLPRYHYCSPSHFFMSLFLLLYYCFLFFVLPFYFFCSIRLLFLFIFFFAFLYFPLIFSSLLLVLLSFIASIFSHLLLIVFSVTYPHWALAKRRATTGTSWKEQEGCLPDLASKKWYATVSSLSRIPFQG
jgi:hypothetical protein